MQQGALAGLKHWLPFSILNARFSNLFLDYLNFCLSISHHCTPRHRAHRALGPPPQMCQTTHRRGTTLCYLDISLWHRQLICPAGEANTSTLCCRSNESFRWKELGIFLYDPENESLAQEHLCHPLIVITLLFCPVSCCECKCFQLKAYFVLPPSNIFYNDSKHNPLTPLASSAKQSLSINVSVIWLSLQEEFWINYDRS